jgi:hypothetical protein
MLPIQGSEMVMFRHPLSAPHPAFRSRLSTGARDELERVTPAGELSVQAFFCALIGASLTATGFGALAGVPLALVGLVLAVVSLHRPGGGSHSHLVAYAAVALALSGFAVAVGYGLALSIAT